MFFFLFVCGSWPLVRGLVDTSKTADDEDSSRGILQIPVPNIQTIAIVADLHVGRHVRGLLTTLRPLNVGIGEDGGGTGEGREVEAEGIALLLVNARSALESILHGGKLKPLREEILLPYRLLATAKEAVNHLLVYVSDLVLRYVLRDADCGVLLLRDDLHHLAGGIEGRGQVVLKGHDVARKTAGSLVRVGLVCDVKHDTVGEEELVVLEGDPATQAEMARDGEGEGLELVLAVDLGNHAPDLFRCTRLHIHVGGERDRILATRDEHLLALSIDDDDSETTGVEEVRDRLVSDPLNVAWGEETHAWLGELALVLEVDAHEVIHGRDGSDVLLQDHAVLNTVVDGERGLQARENANPTVLLDDAVVGGGDERDLVDLAEGRGIHGRLGPELDRGVSLINPDVDLLLEELALLQVDQEVVHVGETLRVGTADHHGDLLLLDLVSELTVGDVVALDPRAPLEAGALDLGVGLLVLLGVGKELLVHAYLGLVHERPVVGRDDDVQEPLTVVLLLSVLLECLHALHDVPGLPALSGEPKAVKLAGERTHC